MREIIDVLNFFGKFPPLTDSHPEFDWGVEKYKSFQDSLKEKGFHVKFIIMPYSVFGNDSIADVVRDNPNLFLGAYAQININKSFEGVFGVSNISKFRELLKREEILGAKLNTSVIHTPVNDKGLYPYFNALSESEKFLISHCSAKGHDYAHPDFFSEVFSDYENLKVMVSHFGGLNKDGVSSFYPAYVKLAREVPNLYINTAGINGHIRRFTTTPSSVEIYSEDEPEFWTKKLPTMVSGIEDKIFYATDVPIIDFRVHPIDILSQAVQNKLYKNNAEREFNITF